MSPLELWLISALLCIFILNLVLVKINGLPGQRTIVYGDLVLVTFVGLVPVVNVILTFGFIVWWILTSPTIKTFLETPIKQVKRND